ncbi:deoxyuridine 5'-triphosphate nucleotidohydrolase-like [Homalodisca vitripennis]|uniref:deoxyuridine 5'-triphosphate nucleotidohydrolase-like n=1 Tax=Homalodisca vitripennis TaxID=197043 RepID=UPI001EEA7594|nr:deoxyuridine 5'-triphosphate nucleotidohydrolase-like [Homalodisca vitripennis]
MSMSSEDEQSGVLVDNRDNRLCHPLPDQSIFFFSVEQLKLGFQRLTENAFPPQRSSASAAGFDLRSAYDYIVPKFERQLVKTDLAIKLPDNCYGRIAPRSGLALHNFIDVGAGVVDRDYTGNVCVLLFNHSNKDFVIKKGDRIAQLICEVVLYPDLYEIANVGETVRGSNGFGSSGLQ